MSALSAMPAMSVPSMIAAPIPTQLAAPPAPAGNNATVPGSFSQWLDAADARRQAEAPSPTPSTSPAAPTQNKPSAAPAAARPSPPAHKTPSREGTKTERAAGQAESENNTAERGSADEAGAGACTAPTDAASLLASLGLINRGAAAPTAAETTSEIASAAGNTRGRAGLGRQMLESSAEAGQARTGTAVAAAPGGNTADLKTSEGAADRATASKAFAGLLAANQGAEAASESAALVAVIEQRLAPQAEARPADASTLVALLGSGAAVAAPSTGSSAAHPAEARLGTPPGQAGFAEQLGAQLSTFVREGVQHARLQLHPLELGPVTVQIQLDGGSAHMSFAAEHAQTRLALEQALPTLAGSLREAGLTLSGGGVFEQPRQPQPEGDSGRGGGNGTRGGGAGQRGDDGAAPPAATSPAARHRGVVDLVA